MKLFLFTAGLTLGALTAHIVTRLADTSTNSDLIALSQALVACRSDSRQTILTFNNYLADYTRDIVHPLAACSRRFGLPATAIR